MKMKLFVKLIVILLVVTSNLAFCKIIKGKVYGIGENNEKLPLPSATITISGTNKGTSSDQNGEFSIEANPKQLLIISYIGYKKDTILVEDDVSEIEILLKPELTSEEVLVEAKKPDYFLEKANVAKTEVITSGGLKKAACCNLSESFVTNPTVDVTYTDAVTGVKQILLLGLAQNYTQLMVEAVPNLQGMASNYGLLFLPGPWINSISISKGTSSVTRGYESITGQIDVELIGPESSENTILNAYLNDFLRMEANIVTKQKLDNFTFTSFLHGSFNNRQVDHNGDSFLDMPLNKQLNLLQRIDYHSTNYESKTYINALLYNSKSGQIGFFGTSDKNKYWGSNVDIKRLSITTKNGYIFDSEKPRSIGTILSLTHHKQDSFFGNRDFNNEQNSIFASIIFSNTVDLPLGAQNTTYTIGASYSYNNYLQYLDKVNYSKNEYVPGLFSEISLSPAENLQVIAGARMDFHNLMGNLFTPRLHIKYSFDESNTIRFSAGKGFHFPLPIVENQSILTSSREIIFSEDLKMEEAWNFGVNSSHNFEILGKYFQVNLEFYYTKFLNQAIVDRDIASDKIHIYNLRGQSFSRSFQIDLTVDLLSDLTLLVAYRLNDVWTTTNNTLQRKPLVSPHKGLLNVAYKPEPFSFDFTMEINGAGRIPNLKNNPSEYRLPESFKPFVILNSQISYKLNKIEIYLGMENISDFKQANPIIAYNNPFSNYFDGSNIWGPIDGRKVYLGLRYIR
jgi:outer membrane receptor for ferrienterochelin and colicin